MVNPLSYVFYYFQKLWYITIVLRDKIKNTGKRVQIMKKMFELLKEYYFVYREGRS